MGKSDRTEARRSRSRLAGALAVLVLTAAVSVQSAAAGAAGARTQPRACGPAKHPTIAASSVGRVYRAYNRKANVRETVGCLYGSRRRAVLGFKEAMREFTVTHTTLSGRFAGAFQQYAGRGGAFVQTRVFDLRSGRLIFEARDGQEYGPDGRPVDFPHGRALAVARNGTAAWTVERLGPRTGRVVTAEVHVRDSAGVRLVDSGAGIVARSLALGGSTVYWTHDGEARSIELE